MSVERFLSRLHLKPHADVEVCEGQNCRINGSEETFDALKEDLKPIPHAVVKKHLFCMGRCDVGPNVFFDNNYYEEVGAEEGNVNRANVVSVVTVFIRNANTETE